MFVAAVTGRNHGHHAVVDGGVDGPAHGVQAVGRGAAQAHGDNVRAFRDAEFNAGDDIAAAAAADGIQNLYGDDRRAWRHSPVLERIGSARAGAGEDVGDVGSVPVIVVGSFLFLDEVGPADDLARIVELFVIRIDAGIDDTDPYARSANAEVRPGVLRPEIQVGGVERDRHLHILLDAEDAG